MADDFEQSYLGRLRKKVGPECIIAPGFRAVLEDGEGRILLLKRSDNGCWGLPAGGAELKESVRDCIVREIREETGLKVSEYECYGFASHPKREICVYPNGDETQSFSLLIYTRKWEGEVAPQDDESVAIRFFSREEFPEDVLQNELHSIHQYWEHKKDGKFKWG